MNVTIPVRIDKAVLEKLQATAKTNKTTVSKLLADGIHDVINGHRKIEVPEKKERRSTSFTIDHDLVVSFKDSLNEKGTSLDGAIEKLAELIANGDQPTNISH